MLILITIPPPIITGTRELQGLWFIPIPQPAAPPVALSAYHQKNDKNRTIFLHVAAVYPHVSTLCKAIDTSLFTTCSNLTSELARKHIHNIIPTVMGRLKHTYKSL